MIPYHIETFVQTTTLLTCVFDVLLRAAVFARRSPSAFFMRMPIGFCFEIITLLGVAVNPIFHPNKTLSWIFFN
jgi:hypothetical protein